MSPVAQPIEEEMAMWVAAIQQNVTNTYVCISMICFLFYDVLIKLDREIEHVWEARWSISTVLFIFARYYGLIYIIIVFAVLTTVGLSSQLYVCSPEHIPTLNWAAQSDMSAAEVGCGFCCSGNVPITTVVSVILTMRLYAMYPNKIALVFFISLNACEVVLELYSVTMNGLQASIVSVPTGIPMPGCIITYPSLTLGLIAHMLCAFIVTAFFFMAAIRIVASWRSTQKHLTGIRFFSPLIALIVRDGALFYFLLCVILIFSIIAIKDTAGILNPFMLMLLRTTAYSWSGSRLVLNLREAMNRTYVNTSTFASQTMTTPVFAPNPMLGRTQGTMTVTIT